MNAKYLENHHVCHWLFLSSLFVNADPLKFATHLIVTDVVPKDIYRRAFQGSASVLKRQIPGTER